MRIPIDNNTLGYIVKRPFTRGIASYEFKKYHKCSACSRGKELLTFGEFKAKFNTTHTRTVDTDPNFIDKDLQELQKLSKTFVFKKPKDHGTK
jgi:hypothetical protein